MGGNGRNEAELPSVSGTVQWPLPPVRRPHLLSRAVRCALRHATISVVLTCCVIGGIGCSSSRRSISVFCSTYWQNAVQFYDRDQGAVDHHQQLQNFVNLVSAPNDLAILFGKLDVVAPSEIEPDVAALRDAFKQVSGSLGKSITDPLGAIVGNLGTGLSVLNSFNRVNDYLNSNCPLPAYVRQRLPAGTAATP